jgi:hypothetical protein
VNRRLIIFTKYPEPGRVKTRLIPVLGKQGAADLQRDMTRRLLEKVEGLIGDIAVELCFEGGSPERMAALYDGRYAFNPQGSGDLGERMRRAFERAFNEGCREAVLIGTDIPEMTADLLRRAFGLLRDHEAVFGPARDGGYYLLGLKRIMPGLFAPLPWGSPAVFERSMEIAEREGVVPALVETLDDVDRPEDLVHWERAERRRRISVVIPALNEEEGIGETLRSLHCGEGLEIIVADGGSRDGTREVARDLGATVVGSPTGRAKQMNAGAEAATGGILFFLHADARPPERFDSIIRRTLAERGVIAGAFSLRVAADLRGIRLIERLATWRARRGMPYGDQGIFMRKEVFLNAGGFPDQPLMEDFELMRRLRRCGKIAISPARTEVSGRRWRRLGVLRTTLINQAVIVGCLLGVPPERLAGWYRAPAIDRDLSSD